VNRHGVELNHRYRSGAVVPDGTPEPAYERDQELYYQPTTWPGARLPHCWLGHGSETISTLDLAGKGRFTLLTGIRGESWQRAARRLSERTGVEIACYVIGPGRDIEDLYDDWAEICETQESGCVLVRPDAHVAYRSHVVADDCEAELASAMNKILGWDQALAEQGNKGSTATNTTRA
ncbi:MAG: 2,4-dichlorophenol 6-monooxygenase, partial [Rubrobacter sp.]|nr:2,4-dichlorophenol 6-monooxygenase [Rubrobacter sp.]